MASTEQASIPWKEEAQRRRIQNERARDVERKWEHLINTEGEGAPEWMRETALKKKAARDKLTASGIPPWMQEVQRRNTGLTKKMHEARVIGEISSSERAPQPEPTMTADCEKDEGTEATCYTAEQETDRGGEHEGEEPF
ncbi:unnamed protein product [Schistocephalus solidus]|uniref:Remorin_C domain-containing protein n=1 Tax=Schistocephalus solidus TaxID=70667 RepID=A0A0X3NZC0_SCHSO|nr:unnamed protein product [Schistocephalus solidus]